MKSFLIAGAIAAGLVPFSGTIAAAGSGTILITVSCFRGPWSEVIWDHPNAAFLNSLAEAGYDPATAEAIAQRVCRDETAVSQPDRLTEVMYRVLRETPPPGRR
jgi:hypothetical protein